jgi:hypothetical protein
MSSKELLQLVSSLSPEQQNAVETFIKYLREQSPAGDQRDVRNALDEFVREHSDLLRRLAQ